MNRIQNKLSATKKILSIYFSAGFPNLNDTKSLIENLAKNNVDMIEIGLPFSDPLADGPTIQSSSTQALKNGMTTEILFDQIKDIRQTVQIPLIIMGYFNPVLQFGVENFLKKCQQTGIDGLIIPDLPLEIYLSEYKRLFESYGIAMIFLGHHNTDSALGTVCLVFNAPFLRKYFFNVIINSKPRGILGLFLFIKCLV